MASQGKRLSRQYLNSFASHKERKDVKESNLKAFERHQYCLLDSALLNPINFFLRSDTTHCWVCCWVPQELLPAAPGTWSSSPDLTFKASTKTAPHPQPGCSAT